MSVPSEYKVDRSGASSALSGELVAGLVENGGKVDFAASMVDEANKSYIINTALVMPADDGSGQPFSVAALKACLLYTSSGRSGNYPLRGQPAADPA